MQDSSNRKVYSVTLGDGFKTLAVQESDGSWTKLLDGRPIFRDDVKHSEPTEWTEEEMGQTK